ncbi:hypothetical protein EOL94_04560 [bacterium]|nr:hypothetical protein [bacterium]
MFLKKEVWKNIIGYKNIYQVSNKGRIKSLKFGQENIMKLKKWKNGYMRIDLCKNGKKKYCLVHRLVAQAFIQNPENKPCTNHINGIKSDNRVENLEWATKSENAIHAYKTGLCKRYYGKDHWMSKTVDQYTLNFVFIREFAGVNEAMRKTGISTGNIAGACKDINRTAGGYRWKYKT